MPIASLCSDMIPLPHFNPLAILAAAAPATLVSWWKPLLLLILFVPWARIVSSVYDKHAARYFLPRRTWNMVHLGAGLLAFALAIFVPSAIGGDWAFLAGFAAAAIVLAGDLYAYMHIANRDDRVPERFHIKLRMEKPDDEKKGKKDAKNRAVVKYAIKSPDAKGKFTVVMEPPAMETPEVEARIAAEAVYEKALRSRASQFEIGPVKDSTYGVRTLVDGLWLTGDTMPAAQAAKIMDFWKAAAKLDVADRRRKQVGDISVEDAGGKHVLRISSIGAQGGMRVTALFDPEQAVNRKPEELGLLDMQMVELKGLVAERKGIVLLNTPPDNGRTTLLYSVLKMHDAYTSNVQTVEMEPQAIIEGVRTNKFDPQGGAAAGGAAGGPATGGTGASGGPALGAAASASIGAASTAGPEFSTLVRSILRRDPDVVGVAELPDQATAKEISRADHERTRTYVAFKGGDAFTSIQTWVKAVGDTRIAADTLHGVIVGKLFRKLCTNCRVAYPPSPDMLKKLGLPEGKVQQLFKKGGQVLIKNKPEICPVCDGGGYRGQEGVYEVYSIQKDERDLIAQGNYQGLKASFRKRGIPTLQQAAIRKAVEGITSVEEIMRITASEKGDGPTSGGGGAEGGGGAGGGNGTPSAPKPQAAKK